VSLRSSSLLQVAHDDQGLAFAFDDVRCVTRSVAGRGLSCNPRRQRDIALESPDLAGADIRSKD